MAVAAAAAAAAVAAAAAAAAAAEATAAVAAAAAAAAAAEATAAVAALAAAAVAAVADKQLQQLYYVYATAYLHALIIIDFGVRTLLGQSRDDVEGNADVILVPVTSYRSSFMAGAAMMLEMVLREHNTNVLY